MYERFILPKITDLACSYGAIRAQRQLVAPLASGRVLEIGAGSGLNLPWYVPDRVERVFALEPSQGMLRMAKKRAAKLPLDVSFLEADAEDIPLDRHAVDTVLVTYALCTVGDLPAALAEMRRVLRPGGILLFSEHGLAPDPGVRWWQDALNPVWKPLSGGCNLNRDHPKELEGAGFSLEDLQTGYISRFKPAAYNFRGVARPR